MYWKVGFVILLLLGIGYATASEFTCGGKESYDRNVCSRKGICVAQDTCLCDNDRGGLLCEKVLIDLSQVTTLNISDSYLDHPVKINIDEYGIPHFESQCDKDEQFALGYYGASTRLWQYVWTRILTSGTASAILGESLFSTDVYFRTHNFMSNAKAYWLSGNFSAKATEDLTHLAAGINVFISKTPVSAYSPGIQIMLRGQKPALFEPYHLLAMERLAVRTLAGTGDIETTRLKALLKGLSLDRVLQLYPSPWRKGETTVFDKEDLPAEYLQEETIDNSAAYNPNLSFQTRNLLSDLEDLSQDPVLKKIMNFNDGASNEFVISKKISSERESLLADDPHVGITSAAFWNIRHLKCVPCDRDAIGFAVSFSPYLFGGRNKHIQFGFVAAYVDSNDGYRMVDGPNGGYMHNGQEKMYNIRVENIQVLMTNATSGQQYLQNRPVPIYDTVYGPLGNTLYGLPFTHKVALKTLIAGTHKGASYLDGLGLIQDAKNWDEFLVGAQKINAFGLNIAYADKHGNTGVAVAAGIPNRKLGHSGMFVVPGDGTWDWDLLPENQKPHVYNPKKGYTVACNNRVLPEGHPMQRFMGYDTAPSYRAMQATNMIEEKLADDKISAEYLRQMQMNTHSLLFDEFKPLFVDLLNSGIVEPAYLDAVSILATFDGTYKKGDLAPALFEVVRAMSSGISVVESGSNTGMPWIAPTLMKNNDNICQLNGFSNCQQYLYKLIKDAAGLLMLNHGSLPRWGVDANVGKLLAKNIPLSSIPPFAAAATIVTTPTGGSHTLNVAVPMVDSKASLHTEFGPSVRILTLGKEKESLFISMPGGNSEFPTSPFYRNLAPFYENGTYVVLSMDSYQTVESVELL